MVTTIVLLSFLCMILAGALLHKHTIMKFWKNEFEKEKAEAYKFAQMVADTKLTYNKQLLESKEESGMLRKKLIEQGESMQTLQRLLEIKQKA